MILVLDNYDSFVGNVARYLRELGETVDVVRNDAISVNEIQAMDPRAIVISPGPCSPREAGISNAVVQTLSGRIPILGICLGHQCIGDVMGGAVVRAREPMHGRASLVSHEGTDVFRGLPNPLRVGRYHSLIVEVDEETSPLKVTARSEKGRSWALPTRSTRRLVYNSTRNRF